MVYCQDLVQSIDTLDELFMKVSFFFSCNVLILYLILLFSLARKTPVERQPPKFERSLTGKRLSSRSMDGKHDHLPKYPILFLYKF